MTKNEYMEQVTNLCAAARELGLDHGSEILKIAAFIELYPPSIQAAIAKECKAAAAKWAKRLRDALEAQDEQEERDWFRDFEWPEDLE